MISGSDYIIKNIDKENILEILISYAFIWGKAYIQDANSTQLKTLTDYLQDNEKYSEFFLYREYRYYSLAERFGCTEKVNENMRHFIFIENHLTIVFGNTMPQEEKNILSRYGYV